MAKKKIPTHAPPMAPPEVGFQASKRRKSPPAKWKNGTIIIPAWAPLVMFMCMSIVEGKERIGTAPTKSMETIYVLGKCWDLAPCWPCDLSRMYAPFVRLLSFRINCRHTLWSWQAPRKPFFNRCLNKQGSMTVFLNWGSIHRPHDWKPSHNKCQTYISGARFPGQ